MPANDKPKNKSKSLCPKGVFEPVALRDYQKRVVKFMRSSKTQGRILVAHDVGTGKTFTAIASAVCAQAKTGAGIQRLIFLTPVSVKAQWVKQLESLGLDLEGGIEVHSHERWLRQFRLGQVNAHGAFLIVDEAHKFRGKIALSPKTGKWSGRLSQSLIEAARQAKKVLFLTATPIVNRMEDLQNLMTAIKNPAGGWKQGYDQFKAEVTKGTREQRRAYMACAFSVHRKNGAMVDPDFPNVFHHVKSFRMSQRYYDKYMLIETEQVEELLKNQRPGAAFFKNNPHARAFLNGVRRAVNALSLSEPSTKMRWVVDRVQSWVEQDRVPVVIYSGWKGGGGLTTLRKYFKKKNVAYEIIDGSVSAKRRGEIAAAFNAGRCKCLLISSAGSEGLDLKGVRHLIIMEPHWNETRIIQTVGRAVRYRSHAALPAAERNVQVWRLVLQKPKAVMKAIQKKMEALAGLNKTNLRKAMKNMELPSADELIMDLSTDKQKKIDTEYAEDIMASSIEQLPASRCQRT